MCKWIITLALLPLLLGSAFAEEKELDLKDLGFSSEVTRADPARQNLLDERTHKLKTHEILGPITWALMTAAVLAAPDRGKASLAHESLGIATAASYFTTAYLSQFAPEDPQSGEAKTNLKIHKALVWVHFPLMLLTPIVGLMAQKQASDGERLHGVAKNKSSIATALYVSYTASFAVMLFDF